MVTTLKNIYQYVVDAVILFIAFSISFLVKWVLFFIGVTMKIEDVKSFIELLQPIVGFLTAIVVFLTVVLRFKKTREENKTKPPKGRL